MDLPDTRSILHAHRLRPLGVHTSVPGTGPLALRMSPVFVNGAWRALWMVRVGVYVLVFQAYLDRAFQQGLQQRVEEFKLALAHARLELPVEVSPTMNMVFVN
jgi:hypothetical protein